MASKSNMKITISILVLAAVASILLFIDPAGTPSKRTIEEHLLKADSIGQISSVALSDENKSVSLLRRDGGVWVISGETEFPASAQKIYQFLEKISELKVIREVGEKSEQWAELELDKPKTIILKGENLNVELYFGKNRTGGGQYVRVGSSATSFLVNNSIFLELAPEAWEYKTLVSLKADEVKKVQFSGDGKAFSLSRENKESKFVLEGLTSTETIKESEAERVKDVLSDVSFVSKAKHTKEYQEALKKADTTIVSDFSGNQYTVKIAILETVSPPSPETKDAKDKGSKPETVRKFFAHIESNDPRLATLATLMGTWQFEISEYVANNFRKLRGDFVEATKSSAG